MNISLNVNNPNTPALLVAAPQPGNRTAVNDRQGDFPARLDDVLPRATRREPPVAEPTNAPLDYEPAPPPKNDLQSLTAMQRAASLRLAAQRNDARAADAAKATHAATPGDAAKTGGVHKGAPLPVPGDAAQSNSTHKGAPLPGPATKPRDGMAQLPPVPVSDEPFAHDGPAVDVGLHAPPGTDKPPTLVLEIQPASYPATFDPLPPRLPPQLPPQADSGSTAKGDPNSDGKRTTALSDASVGTERSAKLPPRWMGPPVSADQPGTRRTGADGSQAGGAPTAAATLAPIAARPIAQLMGSGESKDADGSTAPSAAKAAEGSASAALRAATDAQGQSSFAAVLAAATPAAEHATQPEAQVPTAQASLAAELGSREFAPQLGAQLTVWAREGVQRANLELHPAELGPVSVQIQIDGNGAQVLLAADHAATRLALEQALPTLAGSLREAGLILTGGGVFEQQQQQTGGNTDSAARSEDRRTLPAPEATAAGKELRGPLPVQRARGVVDLFV